MADTLNTAKITLEDGTSVNIPHVKTTISSTAANTALKNLAKLRPSKGNQKAKSFKRIITTTDAVTYDSDTAIGSLS